MIDITDRDFINLSNSNNEARIRISPTLILYHMNRVPREPMLCGCGHFCYYKDNPCCKCREPNDFYKHCNIGLNSK